MNNSTKNKLKIIGFLTNFALIIIAIFTIFTVINIQTVEARETISKFNGTIYTGNQQSNKVTLMINVYWGDEYLTEMLDTLKKNNLKTTFFVGGTWVNDNPTLAQRILDEGHEMGSHGTTHANMSKLDFNGNYKEIQTCHRIVETTLNHTMKLFAPPSGYYNNNTTQAAEALDYKTIMWTRDTIDWRDRSSDIIYSRAINNMKGGDFILMHPTKESSIALPRIIEYISRNNFKLTTISDNISES